MKIINDNKTFLLDLQKDKFMLSNACKYAIRSILYLSIHSDADHKKDVKVISADLDIPQAFLAQLLRQLSAENLVSSSKGPGGGFYLDSEGQKNTLWDVIRCIDSTSKFDACFLGLSSCSDENPCPAHHIVSPFKEEITGNFQKKTIKDIAEEVKSGKSQITIEILSVP